MLACLWSVVVWEGHNVPPLGLRLDGGKNVSPGNISHIDEVRHQEVSIALDDSLHMR